MASNKKKQNEDELPESTELEGVNETETDENPEVDESSESEAIEELPGTDPVSETVPTAPADLHSRLTKTVRAIGTTAGQEKVFALHQLELLTGRLKMVLPAGIEAADDGEMRAGLEALLALL